MRFRAQLRQVRALTQVLSLIHRINKNECIWKLSTRSLLFISTSPGTNGLEYLCTVKTPQVMEQVRIESKMRDEIYLKVDVASLVRVLKPAERSRDVTVKLAMRNRVPVLQFCMAVKTSMTQDVIQEIPVHVLTEEQVAEMQMPACAGIGSAIGIFLPPLEQVRPFVDRISKISDRLTVTADASSSPDGLHGGILELRAQTPLFSSATRFKNLAIGRPAEDQEDPLQPRPSSVTSSVDAKKLLAVLDLDKMSPTQVLVHFIPSQPLVVQASGYEDLSIVIVLPCLH
ncbi:Checkpoint protein hus1-like protein [Diplonema papillatum]|nr:Checkpoint protein hus1-like protein [Diplonema papillatum]KAJ9447756.1 Checkpoint protein hus1-like protein [Diplonema papillatum]